MLERWPLLFELIIRAALVRCPSSVTMSVTSYCTNFFPSTYLHYITITTMLAIAVARFTMGFLIAGSHCRGQYLAYFTSTVNALPYVLAIKLKLGKINDSAYRVQKQKTASKWSTDRQSKQKNPCVSVHLNIQLSFSGFWLLSLLLAAKDFGNHLIDGKLFAFPFYQTVPNQIRNYLLQLYNDVMMLLFALHQLILK